MIGNTIEVCEQRLLTASEALKSFEAAVQNNDINTARRHWWTFLSALSNVYTKLEQGSKCCGSCKGWFGKVKHDRRKDPLLRYLHQARNSDNHGLDYVLNSSPQSHKIMAVDPKSQPIPFISSLEGIEFIFTHQEDENIDPVKISYSQDGVNQVDITDQFQQTQGEKEVSLATVRDGRYGNQYEPPHFHFGKIIKDKTPLGVANLGYEHLSRLVAKANEIDCL